MITLEEVSKTYGRIQALHPTTLTLTPGETTVFIGPSGCGKSTLLQLMIGLIRPTTGRLYFDGAVFTDENLRRIRHRMGYVIQEGGLFPHLSARDNVTLLARHLGWPRPRIASRLDELTALVRFPPDRLKDYPAHLSGGQRQRVGLMRALMLDPDVLLLDEPLGALDPMIRAGLQEDLRHLFRTLRKTVVLVTHDIGEAGFLGDTLVLLREGRVVQRGRLSDLVHRPAEPFVEAFVNAQRSPLETVLPEDQ